MSAEDNIKAPALPTASSHHASESSLQSASATTVFTKGRPPWFRISGKQNDALVIGITGGSASGKTTVAQQIISDLGVAWVCLLSMDSFYKVLSPEESKRAYANQYDFDHPDAFDTDLLVETLAAMKKGKQVDVPIYDFSTHSRKPETVRMYGANIIIFEGILNFVDPRLRALMDIKIFVDTDSDVRLARRLRRDIAERGRDLAGALKQYNTFVKPSFEQYIYPTMQYADLVMPRGTSNTVAMDLIIRHVRTQMEDRGFDLVQDLNAENSSAPDSLHVLPATKQLRGLHTIIRDKEADRDGFVFYADRIMRQLIEHTLSLLPYEDVEVSTCGGSSYTGRRRIGELCAVSVVRAGLTMEAAARSVLGPVPIGKVLIQTNPETHNPELHYLKLPRAIAKDTSVLIMDATIASGVCALMAIRVLLDHGVLEENIYFLTLITCPSGANTIAYAFPNVKIIASEVDEKVNKDFHLIPGIGNFGNRYFGTD